MTPDFSVATCVIVFGAFVLFLIPAFRNDMNRLPIPCAMAFVGIWIEKGMGLVVPGFIPTPLGEVFEYRPTLTEWLVALGIWALGALALAAAWLISGYRLDATAHAVIRRKLDARDEATLV